MGFRLRGNDVFGCVEFNFNNLLSQLMHFRNWFSVSCRRPTRETEAFQRSSSCTETMKMV